MIQLGLENISISFGERQVLKNVSFSLNERERLGIVGVNGSGKSTLIKIISGQLTGFEGKLHMPKNTTLRVFDQNLALGPENTLFEEILLTYAPLIQLEERVRALNEAIEQGQIERVEEFTALHERLIAEGGLEYRSRCRGILKNLGFTEKEFDLKISAFSGGQKTKIALAKALSAAPDLLILDEPTNHLDLKVLTWLEDFLSSYPKTVLLISHDRYFLDRVTTKTLEIEHAKATLYSGSYSYYIAEKKRNREIQQKHFDNQQKEIKRIEQYIEQQRRWGRERNIIAAESRQKQLDKMERVEKPDAAPADIRLRFAYAGESGTEVLNTFGLSKAYGDHTLFTGADVSVRKGDRVFVLGDNGVGKSTLVKILSGHERASRGSFAYGAQVVMGYYDQENQQLSPDKIVLDELWDENPGLTQTQIRNCLALFLFKGEDILKRVGDLSGGEKARLSLAKLTLRKTNLLILDEPTNHLDIGTREVLEEALAQYPGTMIVVSHDRYFTDKLASRILYFAPGGSIEMRNENYKEFLSSSSFSSSSSLSSFSYPIAESKPAGQASRSQTNANEKNAESKSSKAEYLEMKKRASEQRVKQAKQKRLQTQAQTLEAELEAAEKAIADAAQDDYVLLDELYRRQAELEENLLCCYEQLETLGTEADD